MSEVVQKLAQINQSSRVEESIDQSCTVARRSCDDCAAVMRRSWGGSWRSAVYEYIWNNTTLFKHIHPQLSWENRLNIAAEAAVALKEMHSSNIIHGNIKSTNILLDQNYSVKIYDFGTSVLISPEHSHLVATEIEGTLGYIDPEYLTTGKLTIESDVYSFGVVLVELLTEKKPTSYVINEFEEPINIIPHFISSAKGGTLSQIISFEAPRGDEIKQVKTVADIAMKCVDQSKRKRPTMSEVV
ncbi:wall-associated receptor kinase-like 3 [Eucalyptus grandis]|uniref:wall-associated receptor kinase-like 3 n=1 Tax=Eucalyptus grandis TaxID=71139 RepID=UPI00192F0B08|nr:wall-associated receptor kinase-like 3 [Eucalyptus grandis]